MLPDHRRRRLLAAADARRRDHAHVACRGARAAAPAVLRAGHLAGQAVAHTHRQRRRRRRRLPSRCRSGDRSSRPRTPRSARGAFPAPARPGGRAAGGRSGPGCWCRCSISRSRRATPGRARPAPRRPPPGRRRRPFGAWRLRCRLGRCGDDGDGSGVHRVPFVSAFRRSRASDGALGAHCGHVVGAEAQLRQHFLGVLAEQRRARHFGRAVAHLDRVAHLRYLPRVG